jgi:hypothetical protein
MINEITCLYCDTIATSGVDSVERNEYAPVCDADLARMINDYDLIAVELLTDTHQWDDYIANAKW